MPPETRVTRKSVGKTNGIGNGTAGGKRDKTVRRYRRLQKKLDSRIKSPQVCNKALNVEKDLISSQGRVLKITMPDPLITSEVVNGWSSEVESTLFGEILQPRVFTVVLRPGVCADKEIEKFKKICVGSERIIVEELEPSVLAQNGDQSIYDAELDPYTLYITNLPDSVTKSELEKLFKRSTLSLSESKIHNPNLGGSSKFAFATYDTSDAALSSMKENFNRSIDGRPMVIRFRRISQTDLQVLMDLDICKDEADSESDGVDDDGDDDSDFEDKKTKRGRRPGPSSQKGPKLKLPGRLHTSASTSQATQIIPADKKEEEDSGTDTEDEDWVKPNFKDKEWFARESTRCQSCKKEHDAPAAAALCITSHKTLRCYFCFRIYSTTDILFKHFKRRHKQAGRENTLICPFCDQAVPYKSVSCHVISVHLSKKNNPSSPVKALPAASPAKSNSDAQKPSSSRSDKSKVVDKKGKPGSSSRPQKNKPKKKSDSGSESDSWEPSDDEPYKPKGTRGRPAVVKKVNKTNATSSKSTAVVAINGDKDKKKDDDDSGTDSEDEDWVKPNFKDKEWFARESTRCQCCKKKFDAPAQAALCITSHKTLRCYFCFRVYSTTDILFKHFKRRHKQAGRENTLICPFCDQAVPYKSVSCHVISVHLSKKNNPALPSPTKETASSPSKSKPGPSSRRRSRSRSPSADGGAPTKKVKKEQGKSKPGPLKVKNWNEIKNKIMEHKKKGEKKLQVRDLDMTIEKSTAFGKTLVFRIKKIRPEIP